MRSFLKAAAKKGSPFRIAAACAALVVGGWLLIATTSGLEHGKMYLGPKTRWGLIIYCWKNPAGFVALTAINGALAAGLLSFSGLELLAAAKRLRRD